MCLIPLFSWCLEMFGNFRRWGPVGGSVSLCGMLWNLLLGRPMSLDLFCSWFLYIIWHTPSSFEWPFYHNILTKWMGTNAMDQTSQIHKQNSHFSFHKLCPSSIWHTAIQRSLTQLKCSFEKIFIEVFNYDLWSVPYWGGGGGKQPVSISKKSRFLR